MCRYQQYTNGSSQVVFVSEEHTIFGSNRHGAKRRKDTLRLGTTNYTPSGSTVFRQLGMTDYELSNHLGNVLVTITDKKVYKTSMAGNYFEAEIVSITDYYPFGSVMSTRSYAARAGRFGYNKGSEVESDFTADNYSTYYRELDTRLGRWISIDPKCNLYESPYLSMSNNPIYYNDPEGDIIVAAISGFFRGLFAKKSNFVKPGSTRIGNAFNKSGQLIRNSIRIYGGLFNTDPNRTFVGRAFMLLSRFTWELPQTLVGLKFSQAHNIFGNVTVSYFNGATVVDHKVNSIFGGGMTIGPFINSYNMGEINASNQLLMHEFGHTIQSRIFGVLYLPFIAIPSLISQTFENMGTSHNHSFTPYEIGANRLAYHYLNRQNINSNIRNPNLWKGGSDYTTNYKDVQWGWTILSSTLGLALFGVAVALPIIL